MDKHGSSRICPACGGSEFSKRELHVVTVFKCSRCALLQSEFPAREQTASEEFERINEASYAASIGKVRQQQARIILRMVKGLRQNEGHWIDVGCSFGYLLNEARQQGFTILGIEPDAKAYSASVNLLGSENVRHGLLNDAMVPDDCADVISALDVLEHIPIDQIDNFASTISRKLRARGLWVVKVPSSEGLYFKLAHSIAGLAPSVVTGVLKRLWQSEYEFPHKLYFNQEALRQFLLKHDFEIASFAYLDEVPNETVMDRLLLDDSIGKAQACAMVPAFYLINAIESMRHKSDTMVMIVRKVQ